jgi:spectrin beta
MAGFWFQMCWMNQLMMFMFLAGDMLLAKKHKASRDIRAQMEHLLTAWQQLLQGSNNYGRGLEEAQDILEFNNQAEKVEAWIRDKVCSK